MKPTCNRKRIFYSRLKGFTILFLFVKFFERVLNESKIVCLLLLLVAVEILKIINLPLDDRTILS